ncbi:hypothetical protein [Qipengyuania soli]|nr:hypothetical protein [Qipengyuania soli]
MIDRFDCKLHNFFPNGADQMRNPAQTILLAMALVSSPAVVSAQVSATPGMTYADVVAIADGTPLVVRAKVKDQVAVEPERSHGLAPGHVRLYVEAQTTALIAGRAPLGESLRYLVDVPLTAKGKAPKLKKQEFVLFARPVAGRPGQLQLVRPDAQYAYTPEFEAQLRPVLASLLSPDAPPRVTGVRDVLSVSGTLVGESETQLFLDTENDGPVSVTIVRRPNQAPRWGVSWTEIVDQAARPPQTGTLEWYRLACSLPPRLPAEANLSRDSEARALAAQDYAYVMQQLGPCTRSQR